MSNWEPPNTKYPPPKPGEPPLHRAAREGDHKSIRDMVKNRADVNAVFDIALDPSGRECPATPLMMAAGSGDGANVETVTLLLDLGADPKIKLGCKSAASLAATGLGWNYRPGGDAARLKLLVDSGSPITIDGPAGARMVAEVAELGDSNRLRIVLQLGAPANALWERKIESTEAQRKFYDESNIDLLKDLDLDEEEREKLLASLKRSDEERIEKAAAAPYSFEIPLFKAAESGNVECVKLLLAAGADIRQRDNSQRTALWYCGSEDVAKQLIKQGLSIEDTDEFSWTPLVGNLDSPERTKILIASGADVRATHDQGYTVFMNAVSTTERNVPTMKLLVAAGADPHAISELGFNAFHAAVDVNGEANEEKSVRETLSYLKELKVNIEHQNNGGYTPLARALSDGTAIEAKVLCDLGADVNARGPHIDCRDGKCVRVVSPLVFAAIAAVIDPDKKLNSLIDFGAKLNVKNTDGISPLEYARAKLKELDDYEAGEFKDEQVRQMKTCIKLLSK